MKTYVTINVSTASILFVSQACEFWFDFVLTICCAFVCVAFVVIVVLVACTCDFKTWICGFLMIDAILGDIFQIISWMEGNTAAYRGLKLLEAVEVQLQARPFIGLTEAPAYSYFLMNFLNITFWYFWQYFRCQNFIRDHEETLTRTRWWAVPTQSLQAG